MRHCKAVGRWARIKFNLNPKSRKGNKIMMFKQIREIKAKFDGLTLDTQLTGMFNNAHWASLWKINFMQDQDIKDLLKYLDDNRLVYFIGRSGLHIQ